MFPSSESARGRSVSAGRLLLPAMVLLALSTGCTSFRDYIANGFKVGPNYCTPSAPVADQWIDAGNPVLDTSRVADAAWWRTFDDPVLDSLIDTAYRQNLSVRIAGLRILEARALRAIAAGELFPQQQQVTGDYTRTGISKNSLAGAFIPLRFYDEFTLGTNLAWELDFWGRFRRAVEVADARLDASVENYDNVLVLLLSDVAQSYTNVRIAERRLAYARENVKIQQGSLRIAEDRFREQVVTKLDVTQAQSDLANTEAAIPQLESARRQAVNQLCILLGMPPQNIDGMLANHHGIPRIPARVAVGIPAELLRRRPDVRRAEREVAAQSALIGVAASELYPHFSIGGTIYLDATKFEDLFDADSIAGSVGPSFYWNVLNYGRLNNNVRVQEARFQQLAVQYQNTVLQANAEAENALVAFLKSQQQARSLAQSADAARQSVDMVMHQYREGIVDFNRVFNVQQFLTQQQDQLAVVEGSVAQNLIQLYRALGGGWQIRLSPPAAQPLPAPGPPEPAGPAPQPAVLPPIPTPPSNTQP
ncbi:MAG: efflux transporter outer membrane subunit [Pirellulales bacterium]|nr:efflux transporter outer membrane subunit [Pirellulales bacterium]